MRARRPRAPPPLSAATQIRTWHLSSLLSEYRLADRRWKYVVQEEMDLSEPAHPGSRLMVDAPHRLHPQLQVFSGPDNPRVYGSGGRSAAAIDRRRQRELDHGNQLIERLAQPHILDEGLQVGKAVFDGEAQVEHVWMTLDDDVAVVAERTAARPGR